MSLEPQAYTFKCLSLLLRYPLEEIISQYNEIKNYIKQENYLPPHQQSALEKFFTYTQNNDIYRLQTNYIETFERSRNRSLYLFEHVHGDSRLRGPALIDLNENYSQLGIQINTQELPDFIPVFLEYLSLLKSEEYKQELGQIINILYIINEALKKIDSPYQVIFEALISLSDEKPNEKVIEKSVKLNETQYDMDKEWLEPEAFANDQECNTCISNQSLNLQ